MLSDDIHELVGVGKDWFTITEQVSEWLYIGNYTVTLVIQ